MERLRGFLHFDEGRSGRVHAIPEFTRLKVGDDAGHAAHVIAVRVRDGDRVQPANAARPEIGRDHFLADIEVGAHVARHAAGVHQQRFAFGRDQQQRIALADIDGRDLEYAGMPLRLRRETAQCPAPRPAIQRLRSPPGSAAAPATAPDRPSAPPPARRSRSAWARAPRRCAGAQ